MAREPRRDRLELERDLGDAGQVRVVDERGSARPANGPLRVGGAEAPAIADVAAEPEGDHPEQGRPGRHLHCVYRLTAAMNITVTVTTRSGASSRPSSTACGRRPVRTRSSSTAPLPDGSYSVVLVGRTAAGVELRQSLTVSRTLGLVAVSPPVFSPNGDGRRDLVRVTFSLSVAADVRVRILRDGRWVATPLSSSLLPGVQRLTWDGMRANGPIRDGVYLAVVEAEDDAASTTSFAVPFASDTTPPAVRFLPGLPLRLRVSEPPSSVRVNGTTVRQTVSKAGVVRVRWRGAITRARVVAWDEAGNRGEAVFRAPPPRGRGRASKLAPCSTRFPRRRSART